MLSSTSHSGALQLSAGNDFLFIRFQGVRSAPGSCIYRFSSEFVHLDCVVF